MSHHGVWSGVVGGVAASVTGVLTASAVSYYTGAAIVEVGNVKITAAPRVEDPEMNRCKAVQASVQDIKSAFAEVNNNLALSMHDTQEQEFKTTALLADMTKSRPDDTWAINLLVDSINNHRERYSSLETNANNKLTYIGQLLDYILGGCGLPDRE